MSVPSHVEVEFRGVAGDQTVFSLNLMWVDGLGRGITVVSGEREVQSEE